MTASTWPTPVLAPATTAWSPTMTAGATGSPSAPDEDLFAVDRSCARVP